MTLSVISRLLRALIGSSLEMARTAPSEFSVSVAALAPNGPFRINSFCSAEDVSRESSKFLSALPSFKKSNGKRPCHSSTSAVFFEWMA